ncbi:MAG TPA: PHP domain-containing protein, partial [Candidatus Bathyarchaeota archaeon]|nr:PHP domain-containing protein [Candidatus Bathyarchaeota archaeon]
MLKIDMHVHTWYSDSSASVDEVIEAAKRRGLDGVAITDHNVIDGALEAERKSDGLIIIPGEEISTLHGELLALGIRKAVPK